MRRPLQRALGAAVIVLTLVVGALAWVGPAGGAAAGDPNVHLQRILELTTPPEHRRFGSPGMAAAADYAAGVLGEAGLSVLRHDVPSRRWFADYTSGHAPALQRVADGHEFATEAAFAIQATTGAEGLTCTVRAVAEVTPGDCGFVPFRMVSPEWHNVLADVPGQVAQIRARGGIGAILQGDPRDGALIAVRVPQPIPTVVALADPSAVLGQRVRLRVMGAEAPATLHNVVAVRPPADPARGYILLQGHLDGWFAAAADNGSGAAAVLAAAERLAGDRGGRGLIVALYDGEEWGLLGSRALAHDLARPEGLAIEACGPVVHLHDIVAVANFDASSAIASDVLGVVRDVSGVLVPLVSYRVLVSSEEPTVAALLASTMTTAGVLGLPVTAGLANVLNSGMQRSDGRMFHEAGIPVAWPVAGYPEYHTEADVTEAVDPTDLANVATGAVALVRAMGAAEIGRIGGSLAAPGSSPATASCTGADPSTSTVAAVTTGRGTIPATGRGIPLVPAALALGLARLLLAPLRA